MSLDPSINIQFRPYSLNPQLMHRKRIRGRRRLLGINDKCCHCGGFDIAVNSNLGVI